MNYKIIFKLSTCGTIVAKCKSNVHSSIEKDWVYYNIYIFYYKKGVIKVKKLIRFLKDEEGVTAIEYALIAAFIALAIIIAVQTVGGKISNTFDTVSTALP